MFKGAQDFHRVVGLVVLSMSVGRASAIWIHRACIKAENKWWMASSGNATL